MENIEGLGHCRLEYIAEWNVLQGERSYKVEDVAGWSVLLGGLYCRVECIAGGEYCWVKGIAV